MSFGHGLENRHGIRQTNKHYGGECQTGQVSSVWWTQILCYFSFYLPATMNRLFLSYSQPFGLVGLVPDDAGVTVDGDDRPLE